MTLLNSGAIISPDQKGRAVGDCVILGKGLPFFFESWAPSKEPPAPWILRDGLSLESLPREAEEQMTLIRNWGFTKEQSSRDGAKV